MAVLEGPFHAPIIQVAATNTLAFYLALAFARRNNVPVELYLQILRASALHAKEFDLLAKQKSEQSAGPVCEALSRFLEIDCSSVDLSVQEAIRELYARLAGSDPYSDILNVIDCSTGSTPQSNAPSPSEERVCIVDDFNQVVDTAKRKEMRAKNLKHRASYVLVFNSSGEIFVTQRTSTKDIFPSFFEVAAGGVVVAGESMVQSAYRELKEELGIHGVPLRPLGDFYFESDITAVFGGVFSCVYEGPVTLQPEEVVSGSFMSVDEVLRRSQSEPFTPDGIKCLLTFLDSLKSPAHMKSTGPRVALLGTGLMGSAISERLVQCGCQVVAYNRTPSKCPAGATFCSSPRAAVEGADFVMTVLSNFQVTREVLSSCGRFQGQRIIQMATIGPEQSRELAKLVIEMGAGTYAEAPVLGSLPEARSGTLLVMTGMIADQMDTTDNCEVLEVLRFLDKDPTLVGPVGSAAALKLALNQVIATETFGNAASLAYVQCQGLDVGEFRAALQKTPYFTPTFDKKADKMLQRSFKNPNFPLRHLLKDVRLFIEACQGKIDVSALQAMERVLEKAEQLGLAEDDYSALYSAVYRE
mmetsp:Transcript_33816/g.54806  ORF Transcript_33816/g.54806 Transcript_33816/m.54806 type:complete len:585 (+) Transcript_33816:23-1777(+)